MPRSRSSRSPTAPTRTSATCTREPAARFHRPTGETLGWHAMLQRATQRFTGQPVNPATLRSHVRQHQLVPEVLVAGAEEAVVAHPGDVELGGAVPLADLVGVH